MLQNPDATAKAWADRIAECARKREAYQDRQAAGYMTLDELGKKLAELDEERETAQRELDKIQDAQGRIKELETGRRALLEAYGKGLLEGVEWFPPELRRAIYELLRVRITATRDEKLRINADVDAQVIRLTRNVEDYARRRQEWERRWSESPSDFEELAARIGTRLRQHGNAPLRHRFGQAVDQDEVSLTTTDMTSSEMSKLA
jgi:chromosome segregation ATPase